MKSIRLGLASWQMLQRLAQPDAAIDFCADDGRFHFCLRESMFDLIYPATIEALSNAGYVKRERTAVPSYVISDKGRQALSRRLSTEDELPVHFECTVVSCDAER